MNLVYWSFSDFTKSSSFRTINTLDKSNTDLTKAKMDRLKIVTVSSYAKTNPWKICQNLDPQILLLILFYNLLRKYENENMCSPLWFVNLRSQSLKAYLKGFIFCQSAGLHIA